MRQTRKGKDLDIGSVAEAGCWLKWRLFLYLVNPDIPESRIGRLGHHSGHTEDDGELAGAWVRGHTADDDDDIDDDDNDYYL